MTTIGPKSSNRHTAGAGRDRSGRPNDPLIRALWERRITLRLTLKETARLAGVSVAVISTAERGLHNTRLDIYRAWARALGVDVWAVDRSDGVRLSSEVGE